MFCGSWDLGQLSLSLLPPQTLFPVLLLLLLLLPPPAPTSTVLESRCIPQGISSKAAFHNFIICFFLFFFLFLSPTVPISGQTNPSCSLGYPLFLLLLLLLLLLLPVALSSFAHICPESSAVAGKGSLSRSVIVARAINALAPTWGSEVKAWLRPIHYQANNVVLSRQPGNHITRGESPLLFGLNWRWQFYSLVKIHKNCVCSLRENDRRFVGVFNRTLSGTSSASLSRMGSLGGWRALTDGVWSRKSPWALPSSANGMDSMASGHWWTCLVMFSLFLNRPLPSSVPLTMPGSSRDPHLPLCFLNRCFPLWFFFFSLLQSTQLIRPPSKQIKAQGHAHELYTPSKHFTSDWHFQRIYIQTWSWCRISYFTFWHIRMDLPAKDMQVWSPFFNTQKSRTAKKQKNVLLKINKSLILVSSGKFA